MALVINSNIASLTAQRQLSMNQMKMMQTFERLSSGLRINRAKDDAAGLAVSERMTAQIRGLNQAARNANDGIAMIQTTEGALKEISANLQRMRELAVQSANGTYEASDRAAMQAEFSALRMEIGRVGTQTQFNGQNVLQGLGAATRFQVGANANQTIDFHFDQVFAPGAVAGVAIGTQSVLTVGGAATAITTLDTVMSAVNTYRARMGAVQNRLESAVMTITNTAENLSASRSRIMDADFAQETANLTRYQILQQVGISVLAQANQNPNLVLSLLQ